MILDISVIILTLIIILYPKLEDWRDQRFKSIWEGIKKKGRYLVFIAAILLVLQILQAIRTRSKELQIKNLGANLDIVIESERPVFQLIKKKIRWVKNKVNQPIVQICFANRGCRTGSAEKLHIKFYYLYEKHIRY